MDGLGWCLVVFAWNSSSQKKGDEFKQKMIRESLYKILGLPDFASMGEIKKAFRTLAFKNHPDKGGNQEKMKLISVAYDILSKRKDEYDTRLRQAGQKVVVIRTYYGYQQDVTANTTSTMSFTWTFGN